MNRRSFIYWLAITGLELMTPQVFSRTEQPTKTLEETCDLLQPFGLKEHEPFIHISGSEQRLYLVRADRGITILGQYPVATSRYGFGEGQKSGQTPTGVHEIARKIGEGVPLGAVYHHRQLTGKVIDPTTYRGRPCITSRILWLRGLEEENKNTFSRTIYIHGISREDLVGKPYSSGCIRMKNRDVIELFQQVNEGTLVNISPH